MAIILPEVQAEEVYPKPGNLPPWLRAWTAFTNGNGDSSTGTVTQKINFSRFFRADQIDSFIAVSQLDLLHSNAGVNFQVNITGSWQQQRVQNIADGTGAGVVQGAELELVTPQQPIFLGKMTQVGNGIQAVWQTNTDGAAYLMSCRGWWSDRPFTVPGLTP